MTRRIFFWYARNKPRHMLLPIEIDIYRYGSQHLQDHGWGCVYRSLQNLTAMRKLPVPTISQMQQDIGIDPSGTGRHLWIEPIDVRRYLPENAALVLFSNVDNPDDYMLRTRASDVDRIVTTKQDADDFLRACLAKQQPVLLDDSVYSYLLIGLLDDDYIYIDPHCSDNNVRSLSRSEFYNRNLWMMLS